MLLLLVFSLIGLAGLNVAALADSRIIGGDAIPISKAPYQVSLRLLFWDNIDFGSGFFCGGTLISNSVVLTTANCLYGANYKILDVNDIQVVGGHASLIVRDNNTFVSAVSSLIVHESYRHEYGFENDIALLKLATHVIMTPTSTIRITNLPVRSYPVGSTCLISGWGTLYSRGTPSTLLQGAFVPIQNSTECNQPNYLNGAVKTGMFCAGFFEGGIDACQGDSGGPLNCDNILYGIISHGIECGLPRYPGIYTDVYYYRSWILQNSGV